MRFSCLPLLVGGALACAACTPDVPYRYTGVTPAPRPIAWAGRGTGAGDIHATGSLATGAIVTNYSPQIHDTALYVPRTSAEAAVTYEAVRGLEIGVRANLALRRWSDATAIGTPPMPGNAATWGVGPEIRVWFPLDDRKRFGIGLAGNLQIQQVPWVRFARQPCVPAPDKCFSDSTPDGRVTYALDETGTDTDFVFNAGIYPSVNLHPSGRYGRIFLYAGVAEGFSNDGFATQSRSGSTISTDIVPMVGLGYGFDYEALHVSLMTFAPLRTSPVGYLPGAVLTLGMNLPTRGR